jgi:putative hydrolases of HD superfamily
MNINLLLLKIYEAAGMQRWNDQIRSIELTELDKQAHKMVAAYVLGKSQEEIEGHGIDWIRIIEAGFFGFLKRIILTDLKPPLIYRIKEDSSKYRRLNSWVFERVYPLVNSLGGEFVGRIKEYIYDEKNCLETRIVNAAHFYITEWEFKIMSESGNRIFLYEEIDQSIKREQKKYSNLQCLKNLEGNGSKGLKQFLDIAGQLRFQQRWSHLYRIPRTSVLGHMLIVAIYSYLFSYAAGFSRERRINNYYTGLFHDFPEVLTRDVINPVKKSVEGLDELIKEYEMQEMEKRIYKLIPESWHKDMRLFTENEFSDTDIRDGSLVKGADDLAAYMEAYLALKNGIRNESLLNARNNLRKKYRNSSIAGIDFEKIYAGFEK